MPNISIVSFLSELVVGLSLGIFMSLFTKLFAEWRGRRHSETLITIGGRDVVINMKDPEQASKTVAEAINIARKTPRIFISHTHADSVQAHQIAEALRQLGAQPWLAENELMIGDTINQSVDNALRNSDWALVLVSPNSITSSVAQREVTAALREESRRNRVYVIPALIGGDKPPSELRDRLYADLRYDFGSGIDSIARAVRLK